MSEPGFLAFEHDSNCDCGVKLTVEKVNVSGMVNFRFQVDVDGTVRAAYLGLNDTKELAKFLARYLLEDKS